MIFYIALIILLICLAFIFLNRKSNRVRNTSKFNKLFSFGSLIAALFIILRVGSIKLAYFANLFLAILPFIKNFRVQSEKINASSDRQEVSKNEACEILGVNKNASEEEIKAAYKKLILKNHPDHGGSKYIAQKLNKAKDILLKGDSRNE
ncbi:hypothetical protein I862_00965 [endosymbiont of Acanthamoeba sp. UWC8]|nr:hypothetical protein I862_00965 [endosymbiont of Acanthamoeba sp. UWC8]